MSTNDAAQPKKGRLVQRIGGVAGVCANPGNADTPKGGAAATERRFGTRLRRSGFEAPSHPSQPK